MKRRMVVSVFFFSILAAASLTPAATSLSNSPEAHRVPNGSAAALPLITTLAVDRTDDVAAASACTAAANDCSLRGAIRKANTTPGPDPVVINLLPATTYNPTLSNANQENAAATGDLDITTSQHPVTVEGGGSSTIIDATGLNGGGRRDRVFHITASNVTAILRNLTIRNGQAGDDGTAGVQHQPDSAKHHSYRRRHF